jgi:biopolymer transport protein ExbD
MIKVKRKPEKRPLETTVSLINIVFLMLIFFLVAGQLTPPQDPEVTLAEAKAPSLPPPDALYARSDGSLHFREQPVTAEAYLTEHRLKDGSTGGNIELAADRDLKAEQLLRHVAALYQAGAERVVVVTRTASE